MYRHVHIATDEGGRATEVQVREAFTSFTEVSDQSAAGLEGKVLESVKEKCIDFKKCRGQGYDGARVEWTLLRSSKANPRSGSSCGLCALFCS